MPAALYGFELFTNSRLRLRRSALTQTFLCCGRAVSLLACSPRTDKRADSESYADMRVQLRRLLSVDEEEEEDDEFAVFS